MIENKRNPRALGNQVDGNGKLAGQHAKIAGESVAPEAADILSEHFALAHVIRLSMQHPADSLQLGAAGNFVQVRSEIVFLGTSAGHDTGQWTVRLVGEG